MYFLCFYAFCVYSTYINMVNWETDCIKHFYFYYLVHFFHLRNKLAHFFFMPTCLIMLFGRRFENASAIYTMRTNIQMRAINYYIHTILFINFLPFNVNSFRLVVVDHYLTRRDARAGASNIIVLYLLSCVRKATVVKIILSYYAGLTWRNVLLSPYDIV